MKVHACVNLADGFREDVVPELIFFEQPLLVGSGDKGAGRWRGHTADLATVEGCGASPSGKESIKGKKKK